MTSQAGGSPVIGMADIHARLSRVMALIDQMRSEAQTDSGTIAAQRSGDSTGGD